jgi:TolB-like protein
MMNSKSIVSERILAALIVGALLLTPALAFAKKRVVVIEFTGTKGDDFTEAVADVIEEDHSVVSGDRYNRTADRMDAAKPTDENVAKVSARMNVDGVVVGSVKRRGSRYQVKVMLREGRSGEFVKTVTITTRRTRLTNADKRKLRKELLGAIEDLPPVVTIEDIDDDEEEILDEDDELDEGFVDEPLDDDDRDRDKDDDDRDRKDDDDLDISAERKADLMARGRGLVIAGGASFLQRKLSFSYEASLGLDAPQGYSGKFVAGGYVTGELYPQAFNLKNEGKSRNIGITGVYDQVLQIDSRLTYEEGGMDMIAVLPTEQVRYGVGVVYRHNFGDSPMKPTVKGSIRYNRFRFTIDKTAAPDNVIVDIPNTDYTYIDPGLAVIYPISPELALLADARFIFVTSVGEMQQEDQYGAATVTGVDADAGVRYMINERASVLAGVHYIRIAYAFDGTGALTNNRDGNPDDQDVFGALDSYLGGYAMLGYVF